MTKEEAVKILKGAIKKPNTEDGYIGQALAMGIKALEQQEQQWISCSDVLPDIDKEVLVTNYAGGIYDVEVDSCGEYEDGSGRFWYTFQNPIAWMPLPEPYRGERNEDNN